MKEYNTHKDIIYIILYTIHTIYNYFNQYNYIHTMGIHYNITLTTCFEMTTIHWQMFTK